MLIQQTADGILLTLEPAPLPETLINPIRDRWCADEEDNIVDLLLSHAAAIANACAFLRHEKVTSVDGRVDECFEVFHVFGYRVHLKAAVV